MGVGALDDYNGRLCQLSPLSPRNCAEPRSFVTFIYSEKCLTEINVPPEINRMNLILASFEQGLPVKLSYGYGNMKKYKCLVVLNYFK